jgi:hypothetical protein
MGPEFAEALLVALISQLQTQLDVYLLQTTGHHTLTQ